MLVNAREVGLAAWPESSVGPMNAPVLSADRKAASSAKYGRRRRVGTPTRRRGRQLVGALPDRERRGAGHFTERAYGRTSGEMPGG